MKKISAATGGLLAVCIAAAMAATPASAQSPATAWPTQPIKLLLPVPPGGSADASARLIQASLSKILGQPIIIENKPGGMGTISTEAVVRAKPDGYTFGIVFTAHAANPAMMAKMPYDTEHDLTPVAMFWRAALGISVNKDAPYKTLADLVSAAKAQPGGISFATAGIGQATHIAMEQLQKEAGIKLNHVPYRGGGPATSDVVAGHVPVLSSGTGLASPYLESGQLRLLAITTAARSKLYPQTPTAAELGYPGVDMSEWYGFIAPAHLPAPILQKMNAAINEVLMQPAVQAQFAKWDLQAKTMSPAEFAQYVAEQTQRMSVVVKTANIRVE